jgi:hypothetical protein
MVGLTLLLSGFKIIQAVFLLTPGKFRKRFSSERHRIAKTVDEKQRARNCFPPNTNLDIKFFLYGTRVVKVMIA